MRNFHRFVLRISAQLLLALTLALTHSFGPLYGDVALAQDDAIQVFVPFVAGVVPTGAAEPEDPAMPAPTGQGRLVLAVYESANVILTSDIVTMKPDGSDRIQITDAAEGTIHETPVWSPNGTRIAFAHSNRRGTEVGIYVINADGSNRVRLTNSDGLGQDYAPTWSPDGTKIAYHTTNGNIPQIVVMDSDGSNPQQITDFQTSQNPQWSPDGSKIVFESNRYELGNARKEIYVMNPDGTNATRLTFNTATADGNPRWSPDGTQIAFWSLRGGVGGTYVMDADGSNLRQVPNMGQRFVNWSPDGTKFIFIAQPDSLANTEVYTINTDGTDLQVHTDTPALLEDTPHWRP